MPNGLVIIDACVFIHAIDSSAQHHDKAIALVEKIGHEKCEIIMPMHGLFEIKCTLKRISRIEGRYVTSPFNSEDNPIPVKPIPIDLKFIDNFYDVPLDYAKAGDTIYMAMAKKLCLPLITQDTGMYKVAKRARISVFTIEEALEAWRE